MTRHYNILQPPPGYTAILRRLPRLPDDSHERNTRAAAARDYLHETDTHLTAEQIEALIIKALHTHDDHILLVGHLPEEDY